MLKSLTANVWCIKREKRRDIYDPVSVGLHTGSKQEHICLRTMNKSKHTSSLGPRGDEDAFCLPDK